jgi:hypothetical protein
MEPFKPRTKILLIVGASKITFSGNKRDAQIATLANGAEVTNKLSTAFRFKAEGYRPIEISFDDIRAQNFKLTLQSKYEPYDRRNTSHRRSHRDPVTYIPNHAKVTLIIQT